MANPAFVQQVTTSSTTIAITNTAGNCLLILANVPNSGTRTMNDSQGNTYVKLSGAPNTSSVGHFWVALNIKGGSNTITFNTATQACAVEYSGVAVVRAVESLTESGQVLSQYSGDQTGTLSCGNINTLTANDMIVVVFATNAAYNVSCTAGTNYTLRTPVSGYANLFVEDYSPASAGSYATPMPYSCPVYYEAPGYGTGGLRGVAIVLSPVPVPVACSNKAFVYHASGSYSSLAAPAITTTTGNCMLVGVVFDGNDPANITSVGDTAGNTYIAVTNSYAYKSTSGPSGLSLPTGVKFFVAKNAVGNANNVVTVNMTYSGAFLTCMCVWEITGADTANPADSAATGTGTTGTVSTASFSVSAGDFVAVIAGIGSYGNSISTPGSGYTLSWKNYNSGTISDSLDGSGYFVEEYETVSSAGSITASFTESGSYNNYANYAIGAVAIKQATGIPGALMLMGCGAT